MTALPNQLHIKADGLLLHTPWSAPARARIQVGGITAPAHWTVAADGTAAAAAPPWQCRLAPHPSGGVTLTVTNTSTEPVYLADILVGAWPPNAFSPPLPAAEFREYIHGGSFRGLNAGAKCVGRKQPPLDFVSPSNMVTVYQRDDGAALLLGVLPPVGGGFSECRTLHSAPHLEGSFGVEVRFVFECLVPAGGSVTTSPLVGFVADNGVDLLCHYGKLWKSLLQRNDAPPPMVGWNSWDYAAGAVTRRFMDENLHAARRHFADSLRLFCIDEGWEEQWGTWESNRKFAPGLEAFVASVKAQGGTPGIWTAPLLVNTYNPLFYEHPDWFASRADGQLQSDSLAYGPMAYLDVTKPEVLTHVKQLFTRLRDIGFTYFKVDFCHCILNAAQFADRSVPRADLVRRAFRVIREAIGPDAYLLACGAPYESVIGLVDAVRSTGDIHIYWGHVLRNASSIASRFWMHGNLWNCDPDFLVVRGPDTAEEPFFKRRLITPAGPEGGWMAGREFNLEEARAYALVVHLSGGDVILGDNLDLLKPAGINLLRTVLTPRPVPGVPVDLFTSEQDLPRIWISQDPQDTLVGVFNWSDKAAAMPFDPAPYGLQGTPVDLWTGKALESLPSRMPRRSSLALLYR